MLFVSYDYSSSHAENTIHRLHALPVVEGNYGNLVGIVTAKDVMRDVMRTASHALPAEESYSQTNVPGDLAA